MELTELRSILLNIANFLPYLYTCVFILGIAICRQFNTLVIIACALTMSEIVTSRITQPLLTLLNHDSVEAVVAYGAWAVFWSGWALGTIWLMQQLHIWLNVRKFDELKIVQMCYLFLIALHTIDFLNSLIFQQSWLATAYSLAIPTTNITIGAFILFKLYQHYEVERDDRREQLAAANRQR